MSRHVVSFTTAITCDDIMVYRNSVSTETPCSGTHKMLGVKPHKIKKKQRVIKNFLSKVLKMSLGGL